MYQPHHMVFPDGVEAGAHFHHPVTILHHPVHRQRRQFISKSIYMHKIKTDCSNLVKLNKGSYKNRLPSLFLNAMKFFFSFGQIFCIPQLNIDEIKKSLF